MYKTLWAIVRKETNQIEWEAYFTQSDCCCSEAPQALAVYHRKVDAVSRIGLYDKENYKVVRLNVK